MDCTEIWVQNRCHIWIVQNSEFKRGDTFGLCSKFPFYESRAKEWAMYKGQGVSDVHLKFKCGLISHQQYPRTRSILKSACHDWTSGQAILRLFNF
jgi:hypothetical protein